MTSKETLGKPYTSDEDVLHSDEETMEKKLQRYTMPLNEFVPGKRLIDPVSGRVEGDIEPNEEEDVDDSFEAIERASLSSKRSKMHDYEMGLESSS